MSAKQADKLFEGKEGTRVILTVLPAQKAKDPVDK
jgi:C-terminal processing protease CtpA/Prc